MSGDKREYWLTNAAARKLSLADLQQQLHDCFVEINGREPSAQGAAGLREAAEWAKGNEAPWRNFERGCAIGPGIPLRARGTFSANC
jgi:hypothetical protein